MSLVKIAGIQMNSGPLLADNLHVAQAFLRDAAHDNAQLAVLPENFALYPGDYRQCALEQGEYLQQWLSEQAAELGLFLVAGSIPLVTRPDGSAVPAPRVRSACLVYGPDGQQLGRYDKLHLFDAQVQDAQGRYCESAVFEPGAETSVLDLAGITTGIAICYDLRFPALAHGLAAQGAKLLVYPSAFTHSTGIAHWRLLLRARAVETGSYVLGVNQCGHHSDTRHSYGHSLLVDPWGEVMAERDETPGLLLADIDVDRVREIRERMPVHAHQRFSVRLDHE